MTKRPLALLLGSLLALTACTATPLVSPSPRPSASPSALPSASPLPTGSPGIVHPTGAAELVLRLEYVGGFVSPEASLNSLPAVSVYGDGSVLTPAPQDAIYPGPIVPAIALAHLTPAGLERLVTLAAEAGLAGPNAQYSGAPAPDLATTRLTLVAGGRKHVVTVMGRLLATPRPGASAEEVGMAKAVGFAALLADLRTAIGPDLGPALAYEPGSLRLLVSAGAPTGDLGQKPVAWPLATPLASFGAPVSPAGAGGGLNPGAGLRCGVVSGADLAILLPVLNTANVLTPFTSGGASFGLAVRPLLPDEAGCPGDQPAG